MIDIFKDVKPSPRLYIADVTVSARYKPRKNSKEVEVNTVVLNKVPIVLLGDKFPTKKVRNTFLRRVFDRHIGRGSFDEKMISMDKIENIKFSSNLAYSFDYDKH